MRKSILVMTLALFSLLAVGLMAGDGHNHGKTDAKQASVKSYSGKMVCLGCSLKKESGAHAACSVFGHTHVLKTADGKMISLLQNQYSKELASEKYHNQDVEITGTLHAKANMLDVQSYKVDGKAKVWCEGHKGMDGCSAK